MMTSAAHISGETILLLHLIRATAPCPCTSPFPSIIRNGCNPSRCDELSNGTPPPPSVK